MADVRTICVIFNFPDMALDLAYDVGWDFGSAFERYLNDNRDTSSSRQVSEYHISFVYEFNFKARQWISMWYSFKGNNATPSDLIEVLRKYGMAQDVIDKIRRVCLLEKSGCKN